VLKENKLMVISMTEVNDSRWQWYTYIVRREKIFHNIPLVITIICLSEIQKS